MTARASRRSLRHCATPLVLLALVGCGGDGHTDPSDLNREYNVTLRFLGEPTRNQRLAFSAAETRWEAIVTGDLPDVKETASARISAAKIRPLTVPLTT